MLGGDWGGQEYRYLDSPLRPDRESDARDFPFPVTISDKQVSWRCIIHILCSDRFSPLYPALSKSFMRNESFSLWRWRLGFIYSTKMSYLSMSCQVCVIHVGINIFPGVEGICWRYLEEFLVMIYEPRLCLWCDVLWCNLPYFHSGLHICFSCIVFHICSRCSVRVVFWVLWKQSYVCW